MITDVTNFTTITYQHHNKSHNMSDLSLEIKIDGGSTANIFI